MRALQKLSHDYLTQIVAFAVTILDRLVIPGLILRALGVESYAGWTVALSLAGLIPALDFGVGRYVANRLLLTVARGDGEAALRLFRQGTLALCATAIAAALGLTAFAALVGVQSGQAAIDARLPPLAALFIAGMAIQQLLAVRQALYRAHHAFARETVIRSLCEIVRIGAMVIALVVGAGLEALALTWFLAVTLGTAAPFVIDSWRRFPSFREGMVGISSDEWRAFTQQAPGFWIQALLTTAMATVPMLLIGYWTTSALLVAQFGLMRTIANLVRQILQMFANVFGLELGRRLATGDQAGFANVFVQSTRLLGVQAGVAAAVLLVAGPQIFALWTGQAGLYDPVMMALAILTPILVPTLFLATEASAYAGYVWRVVGYRLAQLALTMLLFVVVPVANPALRMMIALAVAELVGVAVPMLVAMRRINPLLPVLRQMQALGWTVCAMALTALMLAPLSLLPQINTVTFVAAALVLGGAALALATLTLGVSGARRAQLIEQIGTRWRARG